MTAIPQLGEVSEREQRVDHLLRATELLFVPIARILVRSGVLAEDVASAVKSAYLIGLSEFLEERGFKVTPKRLQIYAGLTENEIQRIRSRVASAHRVKSNATELDEIAMLVTTWNTESPFAMPFESGPMELPVTAPRDRPNLPSFESLCQQCAPTLKAGEVLEILTRAGLVTVNSETNGVLLKASAFVPAPYSDAFIEQMWRHIRNLAETLDVNFTKSAPGKGRYQRAAQADFALSEEDERAWDAHCRAELQKTLESLDRWLQQRSPANENGRRVGVEIHNFIEDSTRSKAALSEMSHTVESVAHGEQEQESSDQGNNDDSNVIDVLNPKFR